jgi:hypothetical protein
MEKVIPNNNDNVGLSDRRVGRSQLDNVLVDLDNNGMYFVLNVFEFDIPRKQFPPVKSDISSLKMTHSFTSVLRTNCLGSSVIESESEAAMDFVWRMASICCSYIVFDMI